MNEGDYRSVLATSRLESGALWPLPIVCPVPAADAPSVGETIQLRNRAFSPVAQMIVREVYTPNLKEEQEAVLGTSDDNHPYVQFMNTFPPDVVYISGELHKVNQIKTYNFEQDRLSPADIKKWKRSNRYKTLVGFQTRNPMHRCHFELTQYAMKSVQPGSALLLHPIVGVTQETDVDYAVRLRCYRHMLKYYMFPVKLALLNLSMRMAGPREAMLHALVRKNYGCTHFIVGRDHAGPSTRTKEGVPFYGPYDAQEFVRQHETDMGISIITSKMMCYVENRSRYLPDDEIDDVDRAYTKHISGTQLRALLAAQEDIPDWFTFPEVAQELQAAYNRPRGTCYYLIGLPSAGKTTLANALRERLMETTTRPVTILDGDVVRTHLSKGLGFSKGDRSLNVRRIGYVAMEIVKHGGTVVCANIAPYEEDRQVNRALISSQGQYVEVYMNTSIDACKKRDVKGLYAKAERGEIKSLTGVDDPFEEPVSPDFVFTENDTVESCLHALLG